MIISSIGEENIHRGLSGAAYRIEYGRRKDSFHLREIGRLILTFWTYSLANRLLVVCRYLLN